MEKDLQHSAASGDHCPKYFTGDKVYAEDSGSTYQAVIRRSAFRSSEEKTYWEYHVHFQGWSLRHDRWLKEDSIRPYHDEEAQKMADLSKQKALEQSRGRKIKMPRKKPTEVKGDCSLVSNSVKRLKQSAPSNACKPPTMEHYCSLPFTLQTILIDDRRKVTRIGRHVTHGYDPVFCKEWTPPRFVHNIPVSLSVAQILERFFKRKLKKIKKDETLVGNDEETKANEYKKFSIDMTSLFDVMLPKYLLFRQERSQYLEFLEQNCAQSQQVVENINSTCCMSKIYGGEFLLRMLMRLPLLFSSIESVSSDLFSSNLDNSNECAYQLLELWRTPYHKHYQRLGELLAELIIFLQSNTKNFFKGMYRHPSPQEWTDDEHAFAKKCAE